MKSTLVLILLFISTQSFGANFKRSSNVTSRPALCALLMKGMGKSEENFRGSEYLYELRSVMEGINNSLGSPNPNDKVVEDNSTIVISMHTEAKRKILLLTEERLANLEEATTNVTPDMMVWAGSVRGREQVLAKIEDRKVELRALEEQVRQEVKKILPDIRTTVVTGTALQGLMVYSTYYLMKMAVGLVPHNLPQALMTGAMAVLNFYQVVFQNAPMIADNLRQLGILPIDIGPRSKVYDSQYIPFLDQLKDQVESGRDGYSVFSDWTNITYDQFRMMKEDAITAKPIAASVTYQKANGLDGMRKKGPFKEVMDSQAHAQTSDPRWQYPSMRMEDILYVDPYTKEPVLMSFLRFYAARTTPPRRPKKAPEAAEVTDSVFSPALVPVPARN